MAVIGKTVACLRIFGDDLEPDDVSDLLGALPTASIRKGEVRHISSSGHAGIARSGSWRLSAEDREPGDLTAQLQEIFSQLTSDLAVWRDLTQRYQCDVFCGLFMNEMNEGETLEPGVLSMLGERGLKLALDIYDASPDEGSP
jgi:hypothetical protein